MLTKCLAAGYTNHSKSLHVMTAFPLNILKNKDAPIPGSQEWGHHNALVGCFLFLQAGLGAIVKLLQCPHLMQDGIVIPAHHHENREIGKDVGPVVGDNADKEA